MMFLCASTQTLVWSPLLSGVDDVFVFISTFRQASHLQQPRERMIYTMKTAGRATFLTSFTTAAAYAANTFSQVIWGEGLNTAFNGVIAEGWTDTFSGNEWSCLA